MFINLLFKDFKLFNYIVIIKFIFIMVSNHYFNLFIDFISLFSLINLFSH